MQSSPASGRVEGATIVGIGLMLSAIALFSCLNGAVKWLTLSHDPLMVAWARNVGATVFMLAAFLPRHGLRLLRPSRPWGQLMRAGFLLGSTVLYFSGLSHFDMATGAAIQLTTPLMVTALSGPLLGERVGWRRWLAVGVGFAGALIVIRPGVDMRWPVLFFVASALCSTFYQISTRFLASYDSPATGSTVAAAVGAIALTPVAPLVWSDPSGWLTIALFCGIGSVAAGGHFLLMSAYRYGEAATLAPFSYTNLLGAGLIGFLIFGDIPDMWTGIGAGVIVCAGLYVGYRERTLAAAAAVSPPAKTH